MPTNVTPLPVKKTPSQEIAWLGARLREKSTYGGLASAISLAVLLLNHYFPNITSADTSTIVDAISSIGIAVGSLIGVVCKEKGSAAVIAFLIAGALLVPHSAFAASKAGKLPIHHHHKIVARVPQPVPLPPNDPRLAGLYDATTTTSGKPTAAQVQANPLLLLNQISTADLSAALADAQAQTCPATTTGGTATPCPDTIAVNCYQALISLKNNPAFALPSGAVPGIFTAIQKGRDLKSQLANLASPNGPLANLNASCAAYTQDNLATLIALGSAVGLIANPAGATAAVAGLPAAIAAFIAGLPK